MGTRFTYRRQDANNGELIEAPGPLQDPVDLMASEWPLATHLQQRLLSSQALSCIKCEPAILSARNAHRSPHPLYNHQVLVRVYRLSNSYNLIPTTGIRSNEISM